MDYSSQALSTLRSLREKPRDPALQRSAGTLYWNLVEENIFDYLRNKKDIGEFLRQEYDLINYGISPVVLEDVESITNKVRYASKKDETCKISLVTDWIAEIYQKINSTDRLSSLEHDIKIAEQQLSRHKQEIGGCQQVRNDILSRELCAEPASIEMFDHADDLNREILKMKKMASKGVFVPVEEKRKNFKTQQEYEKIRDRVSRLIGMVRSPESMATLKQCSEEIDANLTGILDAEETIARLNDEISEVRQKQHDLSPLEIEAAMRKELDYIKDIIRLSAKRLHQECSFFLKPKDSFCTVNEVHDCFDRIMEFDPELAHNQRAVFLGIPTMLLVPGYGRALYDWKNNRIIVPLSTPDNNLMASIASGFLEYRLDADEDKNLLTSYNKLPRHKDVKSLIRLKGELTKDYVTWMTSEYNGYKVLAKEDRKWFEQEIAPSRNDIVVPLEYRSYMMTGEKFNAKCNEIEAALGEGLEAMSPETLWTASILLYQQGKYNQSMDALAVLIKKQPKHLMAYYNMGYICLKSMRRQEAIAHFDEFCKLNPQSWWATVAMEQIRRLQVSAGA